MKAVILGFFCVLLWSQNPVLGQSEFVIGSYMNYNLTKEAIKLNSHRIS